MNIKKASLNIICNVPLFDVNVQFVKYIKLMSHCPQMAMKVVKSVFRAGDIRYGKNVPGCPNVPYFYTFLSIFMSQTGSFRSYKIK